MKKITLSFLFVAAFFIVGGQVPTNPSNTVGAAKDFIKPPEIGDVKNTTMRIVDDLISKLSLPVGKRSSLTAAVNGFLTTKKDIAGLAETNPTDYSSKFSEMQRPLFGKLRTIMGTSAFTKFLGMKPSGGAVAGNILSHLFF
jgi:hypothetical protein